MIPGYPQLSLLNAEKRRETSFLLANLEHFPAPNDPGIIFAQGGKDGGGKVKKKDGKEEKGFPKIRRIYFRLNFTPLSLPLTFYLFP